MKNQIIRDNERSLVIDMISEINQYVNKYNLLIKKAGGERTVFSPKNVMFPDILLYSDANNSSDILQGWEVKMPDTSITNVDFIKDAKRKAQTLGLDSFVLWNFTSCVLYTKKESNEFYISKTWNKNNFIRTREDVSKYTKEWKTLLYTIILDLSEILSKSNIKPRKLEDIITENIMHSIVEDNKNNLAEFIKEKSITNNLIETNIQVWWNEASVDFNMDENDMFVAYSKVLLLNWVNKILFANLIKRFHRPARSVESITFETTPEEAIRVFTDITNESDYHHIFAEIKYSTMMSEKSWKDIVIFNQFLIENSIEELDYKILQDLLESSVSISKRAITGLYTTPSLLAEILVSAVISDHTKYAIDPCCGSGTISHNILKYKLTKIDSKLAMKTTWSSDKMEYPLQMATLGLANEDTINEPSFVFQNNVFDLKVSDEITITDPKTGNKIKEHVPQFSFVISNLPFVSASNVDLYDKSKIEEIIKTIKKTTGVTLSKRSDLYCFILFEIYDLLEDFGKVGIILSNSWLGSEWGKLFVKALVMYFDIEQVHLSTTQKWFSNAEVITTILILTKKDVKKEVDFNSKVSFFNWKKSINDIEKNESYKQDIINSMKLNKGLNEEVLGLNYVTLDTLFKFNEVGISYNSFFHKISWLEGIKELLSPLTDKFNIIRGERRGWDVLFYPEKGHGIEKDYIVPVLKSGRDISSYYFESNSDAFCCSLSKEELKLKGHYGALNWIDKFENEVNNVGKPLPEVLRRGNLKWYEMKEDSIADIVTAMNPGNRLYFSKSKHTTFINQRLIGLRYREEKYTDELYKNVDFAILNSIVGLFFLEANGFGRGLGALDISKTSVSNMHMLDSRQLSTQKATDIVESFDKISSKDIEDLHITINNQERINFDLCVLKAFGIEHLYDDIKNSLLSMHSSRTSV